MDAPALGSNCRSGSGSGLSRSQSRALLGEFADALGKAERRGAVANGEGDANHANSHAPRTVTRSRHRTVPPTLSSGMESAVRVTMETASRPITESKRGAEAGQSGANGRRGREGGPSATSGSGACALRRGPGTSGEAQDGGAGLSLPR